MKTCATCNKEKPETEFYRNPLGWDGFDWRCKPCVRAAVSANRLKKIDYYKERDRKRANDPKRVEARKRYAATPKGKEAAARAKLAWAKRNEEKSRATWAVNNALRDGRIKKAKRCSKCGKPGRLEAHHEDYSKPLEVLWVHDECHKQIHREKREEIRSREHHQSVKRGGMQYANENERPARCNRKRER